MAYPSAPAGLAGSVVGGNAHLAWTALSGAAYYTVQRSVNAGGPWVLIARPVTNSYDDTDPSTLGTTRYYRVAGAVSLPPSAAKKPLEQPGTYAAAVSVDIPAATPPSPPSPPTAPGGVKAEVSGSNVIVTWNRSSGATGYSVYSAPDDTGPWTKISDNQRPLSFADTPTPSGDPVYYHVTALNAGGEGSASSVVGVIAP